MSLKDGKRTMPNRDMNQKELRIEALESVKSMLMQTRPPEWQDWADAIVKIEYAQAYLREDAVHHGCPMDDPCGFGQMDRALAPLSSPEQPTSASEPGDSVS